MGLASSLSTSLTGLNAAEKQIDVLGNNLANSQTVGFKSSEVVFATQFLQTLSLGASPTADNGGTDPTANWVGRPSCCCHSQLLSRNGRISSSPSDLAIQGDGLFIVQGREMSNCTRAGIFQPE
ncbi:MAG: flagellar hook-basal body complex protein [Pirellulaceae bacterium]